MVEVAALPFDPIRHRQGGRPRKPENERRGNIIVFRVTPEQRAQGEANAAQAGLSLSEYARRSFAGDCLVIEVAPVPPPEIVQQLRIIGRNLNQALRELQQRGFSEPERRALEQAAREVSAELRALFHATEC